MPEYVVVMKGGHNGPLSLELRPLNYEMKDPLLPEVDGAGKEDPVEGTFTSIGDGHELIHLGADHVLDWDQNGKKYRILKYNRAARGSTQPLDSPTPAALLSTLGGDERVIYLGHEKLLNWDSAGQYQILDYDRYKQVITVSGGSPLAWTIGRGHELISVHAAAAGVATQVVDWVPTTGQYRILPFNASSASPFPNPLPPFEKWDTIRKGHELVFLGTAAGDGLTGTLLDWVPLDGHFRLWSYNFNPPSGEVPLPADPVVHGKWNTIRTGHKLLYLGTTGGQTGGRVLDWVPEVGYYRIWRYDLSVKSPPGRFPWERASRLI